METSSCALVATLVSGAGEACLDTVTIARAREALGEAEVAILAPGKAVDLHFIAPPALPELTQRLRAALAALPVDLVVLPSAGRRKALFLADMDSTMIGQECIDELADLVGLKAKVSAITESAMRGEIAFEPALRERVALLRGVPTAAVARLIETRITLTPGALALVRTMRHNGAYTALVSGGFSVFTAAIAARIGFDMHRANKLITEGEVFAGRVADPILGQQAKLATLRELRGKLGLAREATLAVGDGANDLAMLGEAGLGVAFHAKPIVAQAAHARLDHADLSALLYFQGYAEHEILTQ